MTAPPLPVLIDCDPGIDDAVMLMMALAAPGLDVRSVTAVAGNVPLRLTSRNARMICELMGRSDVPVYAGCPRPMLREPVTAEDFHGETGISGLDVFEPDRPLAPAHGVADLIARLRAAAPGSLTLIITGPMTNLACALVMDPGIAAGVREVVIMGGADVAGGNITPQAEFNIFADPHAAAIVFDSGLPVTVLSLDVTHQVRAEPARIARLRSLGTQNALRMAGLLGAANQLEGRWRPGMNAPMHDPSTIAWLLAPEIFQSKAARVRTITRPGKSFGRTAVREAKSGPHRWVTHADADAFFALIEGLMQDTP
ncbi:nucleoside hydrolase [Hyphomonas sp.]|uniref:nucleoside hydrolase n=1 Tax=Hyphomonas sp. TaxID=87 RepID=UPI00391D4F57